MDWRKIGKKLLFPPLWLTLLLTAASAVLLTLVFLKGWEQTYLAYAVYGLAFYTLCIDACFCVAVLPKLCAKFRRKLFGSPLGNRYITDRVFRATLSLHSSLVISLFYVAVNLWFWFWLHSWWFVVLAIYYVIMAILRLLLVGYIRVKEVGTGALDEWKRARSCAYILLLINLSLSGAVLMILYQNRGYDYPGIMIYVMALYSFYALTHAIVDMIRYRALGSPVMTAAKTVSLSAALVSMLNLETAMFAQFGADMAQKEKDFMIILTGAGISITVVTLSVILIIKATLEIRREKNGK